MLNSQADMTPLISNTSILFNRLKPQQHFLEKPPELFESQQEIIINLMKTNNETEG